MNTLASNTREVVEAERIAAEALELEEALDTRLPALQRQFPEYPARTIEAVATLDPTPNKKYVTWLLLLMRSHPEDLPITYDRTKESPDDLKWLDDEAAKLREALAQFEQFKNRRTWTAPKDINAFKSAKEFLEIVDANLPAKGMEVINRQGNLLLYRVTTPEAATRLALGIGCSYGTRQTQWCTRDAAWSISYFEHSPLYIITKNNLSYVQVSFKGQGQAKDNHVPQHEIDETTGLEIGPLFTLTEFDPHWASLALNYAPTTTDRWELNEEKLNRQIEICRQRFITERWTGWTEKCRVCQGAGCEACGQTGEKTYAPYYNPNCPTCHGQRSENPNIEQPTWLLKCSACLDALEQRWKRKEPLFKEIYLREFEQRNRELLPLIANFIAGIKVFGIQAVYNGVYLVRHPEAQNGPT